MRVLFSGATAGIAGLCFVLSLGCAASDGVATSPLHEERDPFDVACVRAADAYEAVAEPSGPENHWLGALRTSRSTTERLDALAELQVRLGGRMVLALALDVGNVASEFGAAAREDGLVAGYARARRPADDGAVGPICSADDFGQAIDALCAAAELGHGLVVDVSFVDPEAPIEGGEIEILVRVEADEVIESVAVTAVGETLKSAGSEVRGWLWVEPRLARASEADRVAGWVSLPVQVRVDLAATMLHVTRSLRVRVPKQER